MTDQIIKLIEKAESFIDSVRDGYNPKLEAACDLLTEARFQLEGREADPDFKIIAVKCNKCQHDGQVRQKSKFGWCSKCQSMMSPC